MNNTNWLDELVGWFSPQAGLRRARARAATDIIRFAYEGARTDRRTEGWFAADTAANSEIGPALQNLRKRSRDLVRNNAYASRAVDELSGYAVGTGITAQARTASKALNKKIDDAWKRWVDECDAEEQLDFYGLQHLISRTIIESGECIVRKRPRFSKDGLLVPFQLQVLEPDYLDLNKTEKTATGFIIQGVEFDPLGRRIAYWLFGDHPGDVIKTTERGALSSARISAKEVLHVYRKQRPGQVRGVPWLAPVIIALRDLDEYNEAELVRKKIESCLAAFVTQDGDGDERSLSNTSTSGGNRIETFQPGMVEYLRPGEDVKLNTPSGTSGYREFTRDVQMRIAAGAGLTYEQLTGDNSNTTFSSHKAGLLSFRNNMDGLRWLHFIPMFCNPVRNWFIDEAYASGAIPKQAYETEWSTPKYGTVDPFKQAQADLINIRTGILTLPQAIAEQGYDPGEQLQQIAQTNKVMDQLGLTLDCDPRKVNKSGAEQSVQGSEGSTDARTN